MREAELVTAAAEMLADEMAAVDSRTASETEIKTACERFSSRWYGIATKAIPIYLDALFAPTKETQ